HRGARRGRRLRGPGERCPGRAPAWPEGGRVMAFPLPQAIDPAVWTVGPGTGSVDLVSRVMSVPLGRSKHDALVRAHEMAHVRYSPRVPNVPKRHWLSYIFAEDGRIGLLAAAVGVATTPHVDTTIVEQSSPRTRARVILAMQALESR